MYRKIDEKQGGIMVVKREYEDIESLIKRFKRKVNKSGIMRDVKNASFYEKPSIKRKRKRNEAEMRRVKEKEINKKFKTPNKNVIKLRG